MEIRLAQAQDIDGWMALIEQLRAVFPGLETAAAMEEHRAAVLHFIENSAAVCAVQEGRIAGALLFPRSGASCVFSRWIPLSAGGESGGGCSPSCCPGWKRGGTSPSSPIRRTTRTGRPRGPFTGIWAFLRAG